MTDERALMERVAGEGLLGSYVQYARTLTRAPLAYHLATGFGVLAGAIGSNLWWRHYGGIEIWPNLYMLLLGPTGNAKTTAIKIGTRMLERAAPGTIYSDEFSQERFIENLAEHPSLVLEVEEFATLLEMTQRSYMQGIKETLTKLFDPREDFRRSTKKEGTIHVARPSLSIIGASTTDWLVSHLEEMDFKSGFMPRFLLWPQDEGDQEPDPGNMDNADLHVENSLVKQLAALAHLPRTHVRFEDSARVHLASFNHAQDRRAKEEGMREEMRGLVMRIGTYCAKLAVLLTASDEGAQQSYVVTIEQAKRATSIAGWLIDKAQQLFEQQIVFERYEKQLQQLLGWIPFEPDAIDRSVLLKRSRKSAIEFNRMLDTLRQRGEVDSRPGESAGRGRKPEMIYRIYQMAAPGKNGKEKEDFVKEITWRDAGETSVQLGRGLR